MTEAEEALAAELNLTGGIGVEPAARRRLLAADGRTSRRRATLPITVARGLATHPDADAPARRVRGRARGVGDGRGPLAAAHERHQGRGDVLNRRRGWPDALEPALFTNAVDRATLDAMNDGGRRVASRLPPLPARQGPACSARTAGCRGGISSRRSATRRPAVTWNEARRGRRRVRLVLAQLAALAQRAFDERWVDAETRDGKRAARTACRCAATSAAC